MAEVTSSPGSIVIWGQPHEHPRSRRSLRFGPTGDRVAGFTVVGPDCPRPVRGRCTCQPDGSWRPVVGVIRSDASLVGARRRDGVEGSPRWFDGVYVRRPDARWICLMPARRAMERLRSQSLRDWVGIQRLLRGWGVALAFPRESDPAAKADRVIGRLRGWIDEEAWAEYDRLPRRWARRKPVSEAQGNAEALTAVV